MLPISKIRIAATLGAILLLSYTQAIAQELAPVTETVRQFHAALAAGDSTAVMALLHPDLTVFESGHAETRAAYRSSHLRADMAFAAATNRAVIDESAVIHGDAALYTSRSHTTGRWRDRDIDARGTESMVLLHGPGGWRIYHIHWSSR